MRKLQRMIRVTVVSLACLGWLLPPPLVRASQPGGGGPTAAAAGIVDVRLDERGAVRGILLDGAGQPLARRPVVLRQTSGTAASTETDAAGRFVLRGVSGGVHCLVAGDRSVTCRVWTQAAAPPAATDQLTVVAGPPLVRGQQPIYAILQNPLFIGLVVAAAIAIPIALHDDGS